MINKSYLAISIGYALALSSNAIANDNTTDKKVEDETEIIEVRGILSSLKEAQEFKKNSNNVVDALVAEDIGKFPDENIAEALQRIPGISLSRNNGEGQTVTVRGLTGNYNVTTLNHRKLASDNATRDFNYDVIASELVQGIEVHKTPQAHLIEGGIGAVVNINTAKPFRIGNVISGSARGAYNERADSLDPRLSMLVSKTFDQYDFAALFSLTHSSYTNRHDSYQAWSFSEKTIDLARDGEVEFPAARFPGYPQLTSYQDNRERTGGTLALQWRPSSALDVNFDLLYSEYDIDSHGKQLSVVSYSEPWNSAPNGVYTHAEVGTDGWVDSLAWQGPALIDLVDTRNPRKNTTYQAGINIKYMLDDFEFTLDAASSKAENVNNGDNKYVVARTGVDSAQINWNNGHAVPDVILSQEVTPDGTWGAWYTNTDGTGVEDSTSSINLDSTWFADKGILTTLKFGVGQNKQAKQRTVHRSKNPSIFAADYLDEVNADPSHLIDFYGHLWWQLPANALEKGKIKDFMANSGAELPSNWASVNMDNLYAHLATIDPVSAELLNTEIYLPDTFEIEETTTHLYVEALLEDDVFAMPYTINLGLRYVNTQVDSSGFSQSIDKLAFDSDGNLLNEDYKNTQPVSQTGDYSDLLPSVNFKLSLTENLIFRLSASQVISRPSLWDLAPRTSINVEPNAQGVRTLSKSNPSLSPYTADQLDTALEWYYNESGALTFASFYKEVSSFITSQKSFERIAGQEFEVNQPFNDDERIARIRGLELAWLQTMKGIGPEWMDGFGISANYTYSNSESGEEDGFGAALPFKGLSKNNYNFVLFYETEQLEARLAYTYRSRYYSWDNWSFVNNDWILEQVWVKDNSWLDASVSYKINDNFTLTADVTNLLDEEEVHYLDNEDHVQYAASYGRRISMGVRYRF